jgi:hypothetical protein
MLTDLEDKDKTPQGDMFLSKKSVKPIMLNILYVV